MEAPPREAEDDRRRRKELQSMWEFASVVAFLDSFEGDLKLHSFNLSGLEGALVELERLAEEHRAQATALSAPAPAADQEEKSRSTTNNGDTPPSPPSPSAGADTVVKKEEEEEEQEGVKEGVEVKEEVGGKLQNGGHSEANGGHEEEKEGEEEGEEGEGAKEERKRKRQEDDDESEEAEEKAKKEDEEEDDEDEDDDDKDSDDEEGNARRKGRKKKAKATEPWMENAGYQHLASLHIALLKNIIGRGASLLTRERWEGYLQRKLDKHWDEAMEAYFGPANPLEDSSYLTLSLRTKARTVLLLKVLCDLQLDANEALLAKIHELASKGDHAQLRPSALGRDGRSRLYWYFSGGRHPYLYRETLPLLEDDRRTIIRPGKWKLVCSTLAEIEALADDLIDNKNKQARRLATTIMHEVVPPLFARELEEEKAAKKKARSRKAGIDARNVVNTRSRRARKAVDYTYNTKELDKAIREYNQQRDSDSDEDDGDKQQDTTSSSKRTRARRAASAAAAAVQGTRSSTRIQQKRKRGAAE